MECVRAAIVAYDVSASPLAVDTADIPDGVSMRLVSVARIERKLLTCPAESDGATEWIWSCHIARPVFNAGELPLGDERTTIAADAALRRTWRKGVEQMTATETKWSAATKSLTATVPRRELEQLVEHLLPEDERAAARLGRQIDLLLALPEDAEQMSRCATALEALSRWVNTAEMVDVAEDYFRQATKVHEDAAVLVEQFREERETVNSQAAENLRARAEEGICLSDNQIALLGDTLFVFDGQFAEDGMRSLMAESLRNLEERMTRATEARDRFSEPTTGERPTDIPDSIRARVWRRDMGRCAVCAATDELEFAHVISRSQGGASTPANVVVMCASCREKKGAGVSRAGAGVARKRKNATLDLFNDIPAS